MFEVVEYLKKNTEIKVISFDIFDTILLRRVGSPKAIFLELYEEIHDMLPEGYTAEKFQEDRVCAEELARAKMNKLLGTREVTLDEIYECMDYSADIRSIIKNNEIEVEKKNCFLNDEICRIISTLKNYRVILISDMYLGLEVIKELLDKAGFPLEDVEKIYISCDYRKNKGTGTLYTHVMEELSLSHKEILHIGDNMLSDYRVPMGMGIKAIRYVR